MCWGAEHLKHCEEYTLPPQKSINPHGLSSLCTGCPKGESKWNLEQTTAAVAEGKEQALVQLETPTQCVHKSNFPFYRPWWTGQRKNWWCSCCLSFNLSDRKDAALKISKYSYTKFEGEEKRSSGWEAQLWPGPILLGTVWSKVVEVFISAIWAQSSPIFNLEKVSLT